MVNMKKNEKVCKIPRQREAELLTPNSDTDTEFHECINIPHADVKSCNYFEKYHFL